MKLKRINKKQKISKAFCKALSLALSAMLTFSSISTEAMAANIETVGEFLDENYEADISAEAIADKSSIDSEQSNEACESDFFADESLDDINTEKSAEEDENDNDTIIEEKESEEVANEIENESIEETADDEATSIEEEAEEIYIEGSHDSGDGVLGDAVFFDENGNLIINTEGIEGEVLSDDEILKYINDEMLFATGKPVSITFNTTYGQTKARAMLSLVNKLRKPEAAWYWNTSNSQKVWQKDLDPLTYDYDLEKVAMQRAAEIALRWDHVRPDDTSCWTAYDETGYSGSAAGENIAAGYSSYEDTFRQWAEADEDYDHQGHRRNMLSSSSKSIGIGHVIYNGMDYWVQEFARSNVNPNKTPVVDGNRTVKVNIAASQISSMSISLSKSSGTVEEGESLALPNMKLSIAMKCSWPTGVTVSGSCEGFGWAVPDAYSELVHITGGVDGEPYKVNTTAESACGKEVNEIKIKAVNGKTTKDFTLKIKCKHVYEDITIPATMFSDGNTGKKCIRCGHPEMTTIKRVSAVTVSKTSIVWNGVDCRPTITVKDSAGKAVSKDYYSVVIRNSKGIDVDSTAEGESLGCVEPGVYKVIVSSIKAEKNTRYDFEQELTFTITPKAIAAKNVTVALDENCTDLYFVGSRVCPMLKVLDKGLVVGKDSETGADLYYRLEEGKDYLTEYAANSSVGTATATIIGIGSYAGTRALKYTIKAASFGDENISILTSDNESFYSGAQMRTDKGVSLNYSYTGAIIKPVVSIVVERSDANGNINEYNLVEGKDYSVSYKNCTVAYPYVEGDSLFNVKKAPSVTITGKGNFKSAGTLTYTFPIGYGNIKETGVSDTYLAYTGKVLKPMPVIYAKSGKTLKNKTDFVILGYCKMHEADNENLAADIDVSSYNLETESVLPLEPGQYVTICKGVKNYEGSNIAVPFTIAGEEIKPMTKLKYVVGNVIYPEMTPTVDAVKVSDGKTVLTGFYYTPKDTEKTEKEILAGAFEELNHQQIEANYIYFAMNNDRAGKATMCFAAVPGMGYIGSVQKNYNITGIAISKAKINNFKASMVYDGTSRTQNFGSIEDASVVYLKYAVKGNEPIILKYSKEDASSDYTVNYSYPKGSNVGTVNVVITGNPERGYTGSIKKSFKITAKKLNLNEISKPETEIIIDGQAPFVKLKTMEYTGAATTPRPVICYVPGGMSEGDDVESAMTLRCLEDYTLSYSNNVKRATITDKSKPTVTIKGKGNYSGTIKLTYNISNEDFDGNIFVATYGRDPGSDNPGDGTMEKPFATLQAAVDAATPGSTIYIRGGSYKGRTTVRDLCTEDAAEETGGLTITNFPGEKVTLSGIQYEDEPVLRIDDGAHNITISGLNIGNYTAKRTYGIYIVSGKDASAKGIHDIVIENNNIYGLKTNDEKDGGAIAVLVNGRYMTEESAVKNVIIRNNSIHDNINAYSENISVEGNCENITIFGNRVYKNTNIGIDIYGNRKTETSILNPKLNHPRNCIIANNVVYSCVSKYSKCAGIYVDGAYGDTYDTSIRIINNEVYNNQYGIEVGSEKWYSEYGVGPDGKGKDDGYDYHVKKITIADNNIHNNSSGGIRIGGYTTMPEGTESGENARLTGWVIDCKITGNILSNNGSGNDGYNGEIHFSKCDNILVSGNTIYQGVLNKKYPVYAYDWNDNELASDEKKWATNVTIK